MVRYPKKTSLYQPATPTLKTVLPAPASGIAVAPLAVPDPTQQNPQDPKVEQLNEQIHLLQEKIKDLQAQSVNEQKKQTPPVSRNQGLEVLMKKGKVALILVMLALLAAAALNQWLLPRYTATLGFTVNPSTSTTAGINTLVAPDAQEAVLRSNNFIALAWAKGWHLPAPIVRQSWVLEPLAWAWRSRVRVEPHPGGSGFVINVSDSSKEGAKDIAAALVEGFKVFYELRRRQSLTAAVKEIDIRAQGQHRRLAEIVRLLLAYPSIEHASIVSPGIKRGFNRILSQKALELEEEYARLKEQVAALPLAVIQGRGGFDPVIFYALMSRLTDMEMKKHLIDAQAEESYEGGLRPVKAKIAREINAYASAATGVDANRTIKAAFLKAKFDGLDALIRKQYGTTGDFSGRRAEYAGLKAELEKRFSDLQELVFAGDQLTRALERGVLGEIVIDMPLIVVNRGGQ